MTRQIESSAGILRPRRRIKRWVLSALALAAVAGAVPLAVWMWHDKQFRAEIKRLGGQQDRFPDPPVPWVVWWCEQSGTRMFNVVYLVGCDVDDDWLMRHAAAFGALPTDISLDRTRVGDTGLRALRDLDLRGLGLDSTQVTDEGLRDLAGNHRLDFLRLGRTRVTDDGLRHLTQLESLQRLELQETAITDAGLRHLWRLQSLKFIDLYGTQATRDGANALQEALPECETIPPY